MWATRSEQLDGGRGLRFAVELDAGRTDGLRPPSNSEELLVATT